MTFVKFKIRVRIQYIVIRSFAKSDLDKNFVRICNTSVIQNEEDPFISL
jgi:hypothetical protein